MDTEINLQYLNDTKGNTTAVLVPIEQWKKLIAELLELKQRAALKAELEEAFVDMNNPVSPRISLIEFLNEP